MRNFSKAADVLFLIRANGTLLRGTSAGLDIITPDRRALPVNSVNKLVHATTVLQRVLPKYLPNTPAILPKISQLWNEILGLQYVTGNTW